tara:strand:- start:135 stop:647 length:513 start_codon:yes stop_codon:yes gene_type:complete
MNIDIEAIVREEIRNLIREQLNIGSAVKEYKEDTKPAVFQIEESKYEYEFPREGKTRRNAEEMALHKQEKILERRLTPEEKGEIKAQLHMDDSAENEAKEEAIKKARIDKIAAEGMAAANKELAEEAQNTEGVEVKEAKIVDSAASDEAQIPKTGDLPMINPSLFNKSND